MALAAQRSGNARTASSDSTTLPSPRQADNVIYCLQVTNSIPTHTKKKRGAARIAFFKTSQYFRFLPV
jgi:hypothetical protein